MKERNDRHEEGSAGEGGGGMKVEKERIEWTINRSDFSPSSTPFLIRTKTFFDSFTSIVFPTRVPAEETNQNWRFRDVPSLVLRGFEASYSALCYTSVPRRSHCTLVSGFVLSLATRLRRAKKQVKGVETRKKNEWEIGINEERCLWLFCVYVCQRKEKEETAK